MSDYETYQCPCGRNHPAGVECAIGRRSRSLSPAACSLRRVELKKLKRWPTLARHLQGRMVRIWSGEWEAWWRPGGSGYTTDKSEAGIYTFDDALARSRHAGPEKRIEYEEAENETR